jgi:hypothetical protein
MKRKIGLYVIVLVLAGVTAYTLMKKAKRSTLDTDSASFAYNDTASISKIHILLKSGSEVSLERNKNGEWWVNGKYPARKSNVKLLLYTLKQVAVKYPVSDKAMTTAIQSISTKGKRVEFFKGDKKVRVWYIGGTTSDQLGTYMVLGDNESDEKAEQPYITYIPGFEGFLNSRFYTDYNDWKSNVLISTTPPQMESVTVEHTGMPDSSFVINVLGVNKFTLTDLNKHVINKPDTFAIKQYLAYCSDLGIDGFLTGKSTPEIDSVKRTKPFTTITIRLKNGYEQKMKLFSKKVVPDEVDQTLGVKLLKDPNHAYILFNKDQEFGLAQYLVFGKLIQSREYFLHPAFVKK